MRCVECSCIARSMYFTNCQVYGLWQQCLIFTLTMNNRSTALGRSSTSLSAWQVPATAMVTQATAMAPEIMCRDWPRVRSLIGFCYLKLFLPKQQQQQALRHLLALAVWPWSSLSRGKATNLHHFKNLHLFPAERGSLTEPWTYHYGVKFYVPDPNNSRILKDDHSRSECMLLSFCEPPN